MFTSEDIDNIKKSFEYLKNYGDISFPYIPKEFNTIERVQNSDFESFAPDFSTDLGYNAVIGWEGQSYHYGLKEGFFNMAHMAIVPSVHISDTLVFPIIFNYRQYLELVLKENILRFEIFFRLPLSNTLTHDLTKLLDRFMEILVEHNLDFLISTTQQKVINDFMKIDSRNDAFRFVYDFKGNFNHEYDHKQINLLNLHYLMNEVYNDFSAIDYLFEPGTLFEDKFLIPIFEGLIVSLNSHLTGAKLNKQKGITPLQKLKSLVEKFEFKFDNDKIFKFESQSIVQLNENEYAASNEVFGVNIIINVINEEIKSIRIKDVVELPE